MNKRLKHDLVVTLQFGIISLIAAGFAFEGYVESLSLDYAGPEVDGPVSDVNIKEMVYYAWIRFYRWWLLAFVAFSTVRLLTLFVWGKFRKVSV